jgi:hypothetical protein
MSTALTVETFNALPALTVEPSPSVLEAAGQVLAKHGLSQCTGVYLLHKHFELQPGEQVVARFEPQPGADGKVRLVLRPEPADPRHVPYMFALDEATSAVRATQFLAHDQPDASLVRANNARLQSAGPALVTALQARGCTASLGLMTLVGPGLEEKTRGLTERTFPDRSQILDHQPLEDVAAALGVSAADLRYLTTSWVFKAEAGTGAIRSHNMQKCVYCHGNDTHFDHWQ